MPFPHAVAASACIGHQRPAADATGALQIKQTKTPIARSSRLARSRCSILNGPSFVLRGQLRQRPDQATRNQPAPRLCLETARVIGPFRKPPLLARATRQAVGAGRVSSGKPQAQAATADQPDQQDQAHVCCRTMASASARDKHPPHGRSANPLTQTSTTPRRRQHRRRSRVSGAPQVALAGSRACAHVHTAGRRPGRRPCNVQLGFGNGATLTQGSRPLVWALRRRCW